MTSQYIFKVNATKNRCRITLFIKASIIDVAIYLTAMVGFLENAKLCSEYSEYSHTYEMHIIA